MTNHRTHDNREQQQGHITNKHTVIHTHTHINNQYYTGIHASVTLHNSIYQHVHIQRRHPHNDPTINNHTQMQT